MQPTHAAAWQRRDAAAYDIAAARRQWVPVHLGGADNLRQGLGAYLHDDGSCGPLGEPSKRRVLLDLMCRGFAVQVRCVMRPSVLCVRAGAWHANAAHTPCVSAARLLLCVMQVPAAQGRLREHPRRPARQAGGV